MFAKKITMILVIFCFLWLLANPVAAVQDKIMGVHILGPSDLDYATQLLKLDQESNQWHFLTVPLTLDDMNRHDYWQDFFRKLKKYKFIPIVRLATRVKDGVWQQPNRKQIVGMFNFMNQLDWPQEERLIIVFNEVNHAKEWGDKIEPIPYAQVLEFTANWAHTEEANYKVLPAAMDLAAPNGPDTMEAFTYLDQMYQYNNRIFSHVDFWNSHSYPNPGFSSSPAQTGKNSIRGFEHELEYLKKKTGNDYKVIITETGWVDNRYTRPWLTQYYLYAMQHVWTHPQVIGVTPFLLRGAPGPFSTFSFFDDSNQPTVIYDAFREAVKGVRSE